MFLFKMPYSWKKRFKLPLSFHNYDNFIYFIINICSSWFLFHVYLFPPIYNLSQIFLNCFYAKNNLQVAFKQPLFDSEKKKAMDIRRNYFKVPMHQEKFIDKKVTLRHMVNIEWKQIFTVLDLPTKFISITSFISV